MTPLLVRPLKGDLDAGAVILVPLGLRFREDIGVVLFRVDRHLESARRCPPTRPGHHLHGFSSCEQSVHAGCRNADTLLTPGLLQTVEFRSVQEFTEDLRHLAPDDSGTIILDDDAEAILGDLCDGDEDFGQDLGFLTRVECIVDRLLDGRQQRLGRIVKAEEVAVLRKEL